MAFGLFKKKQYADTIYFGGTICTMDVSYPEAEAVAVRDGKIIAVGEKDPILEDLQGENTVLRDLQGAFMTPGLIDLNADITPVYLRELAASIEAQQAEEAAAAEADGESDEAENPDEAEMSFDDPSDAMAELEPANEELDKSFRTISENGITTILNLEHSGQADDMLKNMLMERLQEGTLTQRYYGSPRFAKMIDINFLLYFLSGKKTLCNELDGFINSDNVDILFSLNEEDENYMDEEYLNAVTEELAEHGFKVRYEPKDEASEQLAEKLCEDFSQTYKKVTFSILRTMKYDSPEEKLEAKTVLAASVLGVSRFLGSIEEGKLADFAVFEEDPRKTYSKAYTILAERAK